MLVSSPGPRTALSRADVLLAVLLSITALSLLSCGIGASREAASRISCVNNLKQLGIAVLTYHDTNNMLPSEAVKLPGKGAPESFYIPLLPYIEEQANNPSSPAPVKIFLCPSRRNISVGPKRDYGYGGTKGAGSIGTSVLDAPEALSQAKIMSNNGTANTALLSHVWMDPKTYAGGDPTDLGWNTLNNSRSCNTNLQDSATGTTTAIGSPHPNVNPFLFADSHVQNIPYSWTQLPNIWAYDNKQLITLP